MKKVFSSVVMSVFSFSFVSAYWAGDLGSNLGYGMNQLIYLFESLLGPLAAALLGGSGDLLFERVLFLTIILLVVHIVIKNIEPFKDKPAIIWIVSVAVALLSTRFLVESDMVQSIILPYSVLGVAITGFLPLLIYFYFVKDVVSSTARKLLWIFFIVVYLGLWGSRYDELGSISWIYFWTGVIALFFLLFDGTIRRVMMNQKYDEIDEMRRLQLAAKFDEELDDLEINYSKHRYPKHVYLKMKKDLVKQIKDLRKGWNKK